MRGIGVSAFDKAWAEEAADVDLRAWSSLRAVRDSHHMAQKVRALSYRLPLYVRVRGELLTFSISGWRGAV